MARIPLASNTPLLYAKNNLAGAQATTAPDFAINICDAPYNAKGDLTEAFLTVATGSTITNNTTNFTPVNNGMTVVVNDFVNLLSYVGVLSGISTTQTTATITPSYAGTTMTSKRGCYGTDNTAAFNAAIQAIKTDDPDFGLAGGAIIVPGFVPGAPPNTINSQGSFGKYLIAGTIEMSGVAALEIFGFGHAGGSRAMPELRFVQAGTEAGIRMHATNNVVIRGLGMQIQNANYFGDLVDMDWGGVGFQSDVINCWLINCGLAVFDAGSPRSLLRQNRTIFSGARDTHFAFGWAPILWGGDAQDSQGTAAAYANVNTFENCTTNHTLMAHIWIDSGDSEACVLDHHGFENLTVAGVGGSSRCSVQGLDIRAPWAGDVTNNGGTWFRNLYCATAGSRIGGGGVLSAPGQPGGPVQTITQSGAASSTWNLTLSSALVPGGETATGIAANATAAQVQAALIALAHVGTGGVVCTGGPLGTAPIVCTFNTSWNVNRLVGFGAAVGFAGLNTMTVPVQPTGATVTVAGSGGAMFNLGGTQWEIHGGINLSGGILFDMAPLTGGSQTQGMGVQIHGVANGTQQIFANGTPGAQNYHAHGNSNVVGRAYLPPTLDRSWQFKTVGANAYTFTTEDLEKVVTNLVNGSANTFTIPKAVDFWSTGIYNVGSGPPNIGQRLKCLASSGGAGTITIAGAAGVTLKGGTLSTTNTGDRIFADYLGADTWSVWVAS